jgi:hypothetical protein
LILGLIASCERSAEYHLEQLDNFEQKVRASSVSEHARLLDERDEHLAALVRLGYFEKQTYELDLKPGSDRFQRVWRDVVDVVGDEGFATLSHRTSVLTVWERPEEMARVEKLVESLRSASDSGGRRGVVTLEVSYDRAVQLERFTGHWRCDEEGIEISIARISANQLEIDMHLVHEGQEVIGAELNDQGCVVIHEMWFTHVRERMTLSPHMPDPETRVDYVLCPVEGKSNELALKLRSGNLEGDIVLSRIDQD